MSDESRRAYKTAEDVPDDARRRLGDLLLILADNKRLLGMRYADWILGAPALEAGISCSAMAQDEWGHGRILYAMLRDFGWDPDELEHERPAGEYRNSELLDEPLTDWAGLLSVNLLLDAALTVQFEALQESRFEPIHYKVSKLLDEERFHFEHARGWTDRLARTEKGRAALVEVFEPALASCLRWFGSPEDPLATALVEASIVAATPDELRERWLAKVGPTLDAAGLGLLSRGGDDRWRTAVDVEWTVWRSEARRATEGGPDADTLARVRGDRNRALLLD